MSREEMLKRALNVGFSGGEKKRLEILQMALFEPKLAILDETDSGLDIDALQAGGRRRQCACAIPSRAMLVITHYQRLLDYIVPDRIHVLARGRIVAEGGKELALELEAKGYEQIVKERGMTLALRLSRKAEAAAVFASHGVPHRRVEEWKYSDLQVGAGRGRLRRRIRRMWQVRRAAGRRGACSTWPSANPPDWVQAHFGDADRNMPWARRRWPCRMAAWRCGCPRRDDRRAAEAGFHRRRPCARRCWCWKRARR